MRSLLPPGTLLPKKRLEVGSKHCVWKQAEACCSHPGKTKLECPDAKVNRHTCSFLMAHAGTPSSLLQDSREGKESWTGVGAFITHTGQSNSQLCHFPGLPGHTAAGMPAWVSRGELGGGGTETLIRSRRTVIRIPALPTSSSQNSKTMQ